MKNFFLFLLIIPFLASAQFSIKGKVVNPEGNPLPGASIRIDNSSFGTMSDQNGEFFLTSNDSKTVLVVSFIGFQLTKTTISLPLSNILEIRLIAEDNLLEEVTVSTGYQVLSPEQTTGSFSKTSNTQLNRRVSTDLISRLEDLSPGLVFNKGKGRAGQMLIRGQHTISSSAAPLVVIDNFPYEGDLNNINPNDVESVTLLKDASAASIWGARAGNGVIVITTKKGKSSPLKVGFNTNYTFGALPDIFYQPKMSTADFIDLERVFFHAGRYASALRSANKYPLTPVVELLQAVAEGQITQGEADQQITQYMQRDVRNDYEKYLYQNASSQQYSINLSAGSNAWDYYISAGFDNNHSSLVGNKNERYTFNMANNYRLTKKLLTAVSVYYTENQAKQNHLGLPTYTNPLGGNSGTRLYPYARLADDEGNPLETIKQYRLTFLEEKYSQGFLDWGYSPLMEMEYLNKSSRTKDLRLNFSTIYEITSSLSLKFLYQFNTVLTRGSQLYGEQSYYARNEINRFTQIDLGGRINRPVPLGAILDESLNTFQVHNPRLTANYDKTMGKDHRILAMAGFELRDHQASGSTGRIYGYDAEHASSRIVDFTSLFPSAINPGNSSRISYLETRSGNIDRYVSYYVNMAHTYKNRYTFSLSGRRDLSNFFGVASNQKAIPLWSGGLAWNIHNEGFYNSDFFSNLKLRATYGTAGNSNKGVSAYTTAVFSTGVDQNNGLPYATINNPPNPALRWEKVSTLNFGLDFETSNRLLKGSVDYYQKAGKDLIGTMPYPGSSGVKTFTGNYAQTRGHGIDAQVIASWLNKEIKWNTMFNVSYVRDRVTRYDVKESSTLYLGSADGSVILPLEGHPLYSVYSVSWAGLDPQTGDPMGYVNGEPDKNYSALLNIPADEMIYNGPARPIVSGAVVNSLEWKGLALSFNVNYKLGYYFRKYSVFYSDVLNANWAHGDYGKRWQYPGDEVYTSVPSRPSTSNISRDAFYSYSQPLINRGDHIRLQDINLSYYPRDRGIKKLPFSSMQIYLYINNLGILWKANSAGLDPDYFFSDYKPPITYSIGVKVGF